ncbi:MAG: CvpA family protein [Firmicutes bacterium]|nr:CvpA family protein [Bacillota bacterium]
MWIDFLIAAILILCIFRGEKRGFLFSFINAFGWITSLAGSYLLRPALVSYINEHTELRQMFTNTLAEYIKKQLMAKAAGVDSGGTIPGSIASQMSTAADRAMESAAAAAAEPIVDVIISILSFWLLIVGIKIVVSIIEYTLKSLIGSSKILSSLNSFGGILFGLVKGCILSYIMILLILAISAVVNSPFPSEQIQSSMVVSYLDNAGWIPFSDEIFSVIKIKNFN